jgi:hypothetical protein
MFYYKNIEMKEIIPGVICICSISSIMGKVHAVFFMVGVFFYALFFYRRTWFTNKCLYISQICNRCRNSPILIWNIQNDLYYSHGGESRLVKEDSGINVILIRKEIISS